MPAATDNEILDLVEDILVEVVDTWLASSEAVWEKLGSDLSGVADEFISIGSVINPSRAVFEAVFGLLDAVDNFVSSLADLPLRISLTVVSELLPVPEEYRHQVMTKEDVSRALLRGVADAAADLIANPMPLQIRLIERIKSTVGIQAFWRNPGAGTLFGIVKGKAISAGLSLVNFALRFGATLFMMFLLAQICVKINRDDPALFRGILSQRNPREKVKIRINRRVS